MSASCKSRRDFVYSRARFLADQAVRLGHRHAQIDHQIFRRQRVDFIFELLEPGEKFSRAFRAARARPDAPDSKPRSGPRARFARRERRFDAGLRFQAVAGVEQRGKMRVHRGERAKFAIEKLRHQLAEKTAVIGEADLRERRCPAA